jgi:branched-chain amino acid transport system permease protein
LGRAPDGVLTLLYVLHLLTTVSISIILAMSLNLVASAGLMSLATGAFFGIGAYATAIFAKSGTPSLLAQLIAMALAAALSAVVALPAFRVRGIFLLIITIAVQIVFSVVAQNWVAVTGGAAGIPNIPPYAPFGTPLRGVAFMAACWAITLFVYWMCRQLMQSPFGAVLQALRDDETGCVVLGKNVPATKVSSFALSGALAGLAGSLYAYYTAYVDPASFDLSVSILVLLMVVLGGVGSLHGPVLGAIVLSIVPEIFKFLPLPPGVAAVARQILYGVLLMAVIFLRPQGIFGDKHAKPKQQLGRPGRPGRVSAP